jgi:hypothetical protein
VTFYDGCSSIGSDLRGKTSQGETITAKFYVDASKGAVQLSLVSYVAPDNYFDANHASQQFVYAMDTETYTTSGWKSLTVNIPNMYYQIDFVCGAVIDKLGPADSNVFYTPQGRLISADNGGRTAPDLTKPLTVGTGDVGSTGFWAGSSGQNLIKALNGGSTKTQLGNWLATSFPNLFNCLKGDTNSQVASYFKSIRNNAEGQVLATALSLYVTDIDLAGSTVAADYGFNVSFLGSSVKRYNVGSLGNELDSSLKDNTSYSLWDLLTAVDGNSLNGTIKTGRSTASTVFAAINQKGYI